MARVDATERQARAAEIEAGARTLFESIVTQEAPGFIVPSSWDWFCDKCLWPLVATLGARTYELLASGVGMGTAAKELVGFLDDVPAEQRPSVRTAVELFLASSDPMVRQYVLRRLHGQLLSLASRLPAGSLDALQSGRGGPVKLKLFLDTNFLFSVLGLHDNPANQAADDLITLLASVKSRVQADLYVVPLTVDEVRRTLTGYERSLEQVNVTPRLGELASGLHGEFSGITLKFLSAVQAAGRRISVRDYLGPYLEDLVTIVRDRGIELYNENTETLSTEQPIIDDILNQQTFQAAGNRKQKSYESLRHDVTLWHLVNRKRPQRLDAPLDATYWLATVDFRLLGFDAFKQKGQQRSVPVCVHPAVLVQMLQLWLPRSPEFEAALFESLSASLPHAFDSQAEQMSLRILRALSRFEDVDDLPKDTVTSILVNQALRARMGNESDVEKQIVLVRDAIVADAAATRESLERERVKSAELAAELELARKNLGSVDLASGVAVAAAEQKIEAKEAELARERLASSQLAERLAAIERALAVEKHDRLAERAMTASRQTQVWFVVVAALALAALITSGWFGARFAAPWLSVPKARFLAVSIAISVWSVGAMLFGKRTVHLKEWASLTQLVRLLGWLAAGAAAVAFSLIAQALWVWFSQTP